MSKWTKGPWKAYESTERMPFPAGVAHSVGTLDGRGSNLSIICEMVGQGENGKYSAAITNANARLIAAAPELAECLREILESAPARHWTGAFSKACALLVRLEAE